MKKERLTPDKVRRDLCKVAAGRETVTAEWRLRYILPGLALAVLLGIFLRSVWIGLLILLFPVYHIVRWIMTAREGKAAWQALLGMVQRDDLAVSVETLSHISEETVYEPGVREQEYRIIKVFYFMSGASWRMPEVTHYTWSETHYLSCQGLDNTSLAGDSFYLISLQTDHDIAYIYNTKMFEFKNVSG